MKVFISLVIIALVVGGALAFTKEQQEKVSKIIEECNKSKNVSDEQLFKLSQAKFNELELETKCFANCVFEKINFLKNGVVQVAVVGAKLIKAGTKKKDVMEFINSCKDPKGANNCEKAIQFYKCYTEHKGTTTAQQQKVRKIVEECSKGRNISEEQLDKLSKGDMNNLNFEMKCFANCVLEKIEFLKDGVVQEAVVSDTLTKSGSKKEDVIEFLKACKDRKGTNNCETAIEFYKCYTEQKIFKSKS